MAKLQMMRKAVGQVYEVAETGADIALAPLAEVVGGSYALLFRTAASGGDVEEAFCHGVDQGYVKRLIQASNERIMPGWLGTLPPGSVFDRTVFGSDQVFGRTAFFNHVIRPEGQFHCMIGTPYVSSRHRFHLVLGRPTYKAEFDGEDRRLLQAVLPHVREVIRMRANVMAAEAAAQRAERAFDALPVAALMTSVSAKVKSANQKAKSILAEGRVIGVDGTGRLLAAAAADTAILRQAIADVAFGHRQTRLVDISRPSGEPIRLTVSLVDDPDDCGLDATIMIVAEFHDGTEEGLQVAGVARSYGLTRRETELATLLARGRSLQDASRELGMSYNTGRTYLRQVFGKVDLHRQGDLIRLFTTGQRPQAGGG